MTPATYYRLCFHYKVAPRDLIKRGPLDSPESDAVRHGTLRRFHAYIKDNPTTKTERKYKRAKFRRALPVINYLEVFYLERFTGGEWLDTYTLADKVVKLGLMVLKGSYPYAQDDKHHSHATAEAMDAVNAWKEVNNLYEKKTVYDIEQGKKRIEEARP